MSDKVHSKGNVIGYRKGLPIVEWITFEQGESLVRFDFARQAMEGQDGSIPLNQLKEGEIVLSPGAIYK